MDGISFIIDCELYNRLQSNLPLQVDFDDRYLNSLRVRISPARPSNG